MSDSQLQNRHSRRNGNGTAQAVTRSEELNTVKGELNTVKEQISRLQEKLEQTIRSKGQLFSLNCRLVEDLKMANMPLTQAYKVSNPVPVDQIELHMSESSLSGEYLTHWNDVMYFHAFPSSEIPVKQSLPAVSPRICPHL